MAIFGAVVLHANGSGNLGSQRVIDGTVRGLLVDASEGIEVPVVVVPEGAGSVAAAFGPLVLHAIGLIGGGVIDAAAGFEQHADGGLFLLRGKGGRIVVDVELGERVVEMNFAAGNGVADKRREEALAAGVKLGASSGVAALRDDEAVLDEHDRGDANLLDVFLYTGHAFQIPAGGGGGGVGPIFAGKDCCLLGRCRESAKKDGGEDAGASHRAMIAGRAGYGARRFSVMVTQFDRLEVL